MKTKKYKRLSFKERVIIQTLIDEDKTKAFIAKKLNRARSTISREINKLVVNKDDKYDATLANWLAKDDYLNKRNLDKINTHIKLKFFVYKGLLQGWSPDQIAGRLKDKYPNDPVMSISYEAIYMHIYRHRQASLNKKLIKLLPYQKSQRRRAHAKTKRGSKIKDVINIKDRPKHIENRLEIGHWEGDLVIGKGQKSAIGTIVERKSRFVCIIKLKDRKSATVTKQFAKVLQGFNQHLIKTMTYDNGNEMAKHKDFTKKTGIKVYFADPYASWQRGTNENTNGLIRRYFPKRTDFNKVTAKQLKHVQDKLNNRPRKIINYKTPNEIFKQNAA
ncbi:IS30 family transposase [Zunongwangia sp. SCSIO 43204]|uniref:IS30 family transposase n=1 Tax=Zunongwangia sp. SCSIO 43204 TaxID=2779359 RepID=UPI001CA90727|nr:IS30 family transposase [Zunongwangia sp. SCSIO 43204]UAB83170.1 IS30 family transposase [Zunongwangia sp. SCSIO 43204]UAB83304.1 IS30 family transposase [Zunongwangia sp. SCSIO 43204]UAB83307.1 IS30 family transposase [Zunongwangia sp. SCSIO 43204]UAB83316.1 IS30 family transposase [Zunongwangia sp. SCSIO 43204]UAB83319.1 IS30 family transposase [Zunongwangia sp. SCSIO 43204]